MKKIILLIIFMNIFSINVFATSVPPDYKSDGLGWFFSLSYDKIFNENNGYFTLDIFETSILPSSSIWTWHLGILTQFSFKINIFDIFYSMGFTVYPLRKILSFSGNFGFGWSLMTLNHFSYLADFKTNIDIPIYKEHNLTFGAGLRHRNSIKIIDYLNLGNDYHRIYNSYFFEIGYRFIMK
jgi:hypothetical protein